VLLYPERAQWSTPNFAITELAAGIHIAPIEFVVTSAVRHGITAAVRAIAISLSHPMRCLLCRQKIVRVDSVVRHDDTIHLIGRCCGGRPERDALIMARLKKSDTPQEDKNDVPQAPMVSNTKGES
jgi:hypothetical protein